MGLHRPHPARVLAGVVEAAQRLAGGGGESAGKRNAREEGGGRGGRWAGQAEIVLGHLHGGSGQGAGQSRVVVDGRKNIRRQGDLLPLRLAPPYRELETPDDELVERLLG